MHNPYAALRDIPVDLWLLDPPYDREKPLAGLAKPPVPGAIVVLDVATRASLRPLLTEWMPVVRRSVVASPVVVRFSAPGDPEDVHLARFAGALRARAVLMGNEPPLPTLRRLLTQPANLPDDVAEWLSLLRPRTDPRLLRLVDELMRKAGRVHGLANALFEIGEHERTVRAWLHAARLPSAGGFVRFGRVLPLLLEIQRFPERSIQTIVQAHGPLEPSAFSNRVQRLIGVRPGFVRHRLGWEWIAARFLEYHSGLRKSSD